MTLTELQTIWNTFSLNIEENTKINKRILREMLARKSFKSINWLKLKSAFQLIASVVIVILFIKDVKLRDPGSELYTGIILLTLLVIFGFFRELKYLSLLRSINMSNPIKILKEKLIAAQTHKLLTIKYNFWLSPLSPLALFLIIPIQLDHLQITLPVLIIVLAYITVSFYRFKSTNEEFDNLNQQFAELESLEE